MTEVAAQIDIAASPQAVWEVITDPHRYDEWVTIHRKVGEHSDGRARVGYEVEQTLALAGAPFKVHWTLTACDAPSYLRWEGKGPAGSTARTEMRLDAATVDGTSGCHFDYVNEFKAPGGPLGRIAGRVLVGGISQREARGTLQRLKALLEQGDSHSHSAD